MKFGLGHVYLSTFPVECCFDKRFDRMACEADCSALPENAGLTRHEHESNPSKKSSALPENAGLTRLDLTNDFSLGRVQRCLKMQASRDFESNIGKDVLEFSVA